MGIGAIPLWTTGFAHVEQQSWKKNAPLSFGLINGASATGTCGHEYFDPVKKSFLKNY